MDNMTRPSDPLSPASAPAISDQAEQRTAPTPLLSRVEAARELMRRLLVPMVDGLTGLYELPLWRQSTPASPQAALQPPTSHRPSVPSESAAGSQTQSEPNPGPQRAASQAPATDPSPEVAADAAPAAGATPPWQPPPAGARKPRLHVRQGQSAADVATGSTEKLVANSFPEVKEARVDYPPGEYGLFAAEPIRRGTVIGWYTGKIYMTEAELEAAQAKYGEEECIEKAYVFEVRDPKNPDRIIYHIDAFEPEAPGGELCDVRRINHSFNVNCFFSARKKPGAPESRGIAVVAQQNIKAGEQLLIYYGDNYHERLVERFGEAAANDNRKPANKRLLPETTAKRANDATNQALQGPRSPMPETPAKRVKVPRTQTPQEPRPPLPAPPRPAAKRPRQNRDTAAAQMLMAMRQVRDEATLPAPGTRKRPRANNTATGGQAKRTKGSRAEVALEAALADAVETLLDAARTMAETPRETEAARQARPNQRANAQPVETAGGAAPEAAELSGPARALAQITRAALRQQKTPTSRVAPNEAQATTAGPGTIPQTSEQTSPEMEKANTRVQPRGQTPPVAEAPRATPSAAAPQVQAVAATPWDQVWQACIQGSVSDVAGAIAKAHMPEQSLRTLLCRLAAHPQHHAALAAALSTVHAPDVVSGVLTHMLVAAHTAHEGSVNTWLANFGASHPEVLRAGLLHAGAFALSVAVEFNREASLLQLLDVLDISPDLVTTLLSTAARFCEPTLVRSLTERLLSVQPAAVRAQHVARQFLEHAQLASIATYGTGVGWQAVTSAIAHAAPAKRKAMTARLKLSRAHTAARVDADEIGQRFVQHTETTVTRLNALIQETKGARKLDEMLDNYLADAVVRAAYVGRADILECMFNHADIGQQRCSEALRSVEGYLELATRGALEHDGLATFRQVAKLAAYDESDSDDDYDDNAQQHALVALANALGDTQAATWLASSQASLAVAHASTR